MSKNQFIMFYVIPIILCLIFFLVTTSKQFYSSKQSDDSGVGEIHMAFHPSSKNIFI